MKNKILLFLLSIGICYSNGYSININKKASAFDIGKDQIKMLNARNKFLSRDYKGALEIYMELHNDNKENATVCNRIGECYLAMNEIDKAIEFFEKATKLDPKSFKNIHMSLGMAYHRTGQIDKALDEYEQYKRTLSPKQLKDNDIQMLIDQATRAKNMMANPVNVKIENIGEAINSPYDDYSPSITADGKTMIFTSRRADTKGGKLDYEYDRKYFEDIYISTWDSVNNKWGAAEGIKGSLNSEGHDASLSIAPSGREIYVYRNIAGETKSGDIFVSKLSNSGKWGTPKPFESPVNSSYFESSATLSADGKTLFFVSERKGGYGNGDIYMVKKITKRDWGEPVNIGPVINTIEDEVSVFFHPDGKTLFFSSKGHSSIGGYDIFKTTLENGKWSIPENLGYPINTVDDDLHFVLSTDNRTGYYSSFSAKGLGERDIYKIDMSGYSVLGKKGEEFKGPFLTIVKGNVYDSNAGEVVETDIIIKDEAGTVVSTINSSVEGDYFITLPSDKKYTFSIKKEGYKEISESILLPSDKSGTATIVKHFILEKIK